jgi:peptide/nickel transport system permease protein
VARRSLRLLRHNWPLILVAAWVLVIIAPSLIAPYDPDVLNLNARLQGPSSTHLFGTDEAGRDVFSRCVWAVRYSLGAAFGIVLTAAIVGSVIGGLAGMGRPLVDATLMRSTDVFIAFPYLILAIAIAAAVGRGLTTVILALILVWWPSYARLVRGQILSLRERPFVDGAKACGTSDWRIFRKHLVPHLLPQLGARIPIDVGYAVVALTGLSFLGLGAQPPTPELGAMIADARGYMLQSWWYSTMPGVVILLAVLSSTIVGDWLEKRNRSASRG